MTAPSTAPDNPNHADQIILLAEVQAFETRLGKRNTRDVRSARDLMTAVREVVPVDVVKARQLFKIAIERYQEVLGKENQMWYFFGGLCSVVFIGLVASFLIDMGKDTWLKDMAGDLTGPKQVAYLIYFSCTGAFASMIMRLPSIGMSNEERRIYVFFSAGLPPLVAVCFMGVVYVMLLAGVLSINLGSASTHGSASIWIAAFLCGFSEKFAPSLLALTETALSSSKKHSAKADT